MNTLKELIAKYLGPYEHISIVVYDDERQEFLDELLALGYRHFNNSNPTVEDIGITNSIHDNIFGRIPPWMFGLMEQNVRKGEYKHCFLASYSRLKQGKHPGYPIFKKRHLQIKGHYTYEPLDFKKLPKFKLKGGRH